MFSVAYNKKDMHYQLAYAWIRMGRYNEVDLDKLHNDGKITMSQKLRLQIWKHFMMQD